ncbi:hypothetical protein [Deminuibacter soli]|nr:hypothetical protein [Deminuibacter soli]
MAKGSSGTLKYLNNKLAGGAVNQRGNDYETCVAISKLLQLVNAFSAQLRLITISSQVHAFVDDLYIENLIPGEVTETYHQLKTSSKKLYWGNKSKTGSLHFDFSKQAALLKRRHVHFQLKLVVANKTVYNNAVLKLPQSLKKITAVELFPWHDSINQQLRLNPSFRATAAALCAFSETDKLESLVAHFAGAWAMCHKKNISLEAFFDLVKSRGLAFLKSTFHPALHPQAKLILDTIPGFHYQLAHGYLVWNFSSTDKGNIPHYLDSSEFRNIENEILTQKPQTFYDLEQIIS